MYTNVIRYKNKILARVINNNSNRSECIKTTFRPSLYIKTEDNSNTLFKNMHNESLSKHTFKNMYEAKEFINEYDGDVYGTTNYVTQYINEKWSEISDINFDSINTVFLDIEVEINKDGDFPEPKNAFEPINAITVKSSKDDIYYIFTYKNYDPDKTELNYLKGKIKYIQCDNEIELLQGFLIWWTSKKYSPDVISGWYIKGFDIPYIINRYKRVFGSLDIYKKFSPWGIVDEYTYHGKHGGENISFKLLGISVLDYIDIFQKFEYSYGNLESYKLDNVAHVVLGEKKLSYSEYAGLYELAEKNPQKFCDYNIKDVYLVQELENKLGLLQLIFTMAYDAGSNFEDTLGTVGIWDNLIYKYLKKKNIIVPPKKDADTQKVSYAGGYVKPPQCGMHEWIVTLDLNSLYPSIIMQWNMSPETIIEYDSNYSGEYSIAANNAKFRNDKQGIIPEIITELYESRKEFKKLEYSAAKILENKDNLSDKEILEHTNKKTLYHNTQMVKKIFLNSGYGAIANKYFRHYDLRIAEGITLSGQMIIKDIEKNLNIFLNNKLNTNNIDYVIAMDTDSVMLNLSSLIINNNIDNNSLVDYLDIYTKKYIEPELERIFTNIANKYNCFKNKMVMEREKIAAKGFWCCHPKTEIIIDNNIITLETLYHNSENGTVNKPTISFNKHNNNFELDIVEDIIRKKVSSELLYKFEFDNGTILRVTGEHIIFVKNEYNDIIEKKAKNITLRDEILHI